MLYLIALPSLQDGKRDFSLILASLPAPAAVQEPLEISLRKCFKIARRR